MPKLSRYMEEYGPHVLSTYYGADFIRQNTLGDPTPPIFPIFHLLALFVGIGGDANFSVRVQGNANFNN